MHFAKKDSVSEKYIFCEKINICFNMHDKVRILMNIQENRSYKILIDHSYFY